MGSLEAARADRQMRPAATEPPELDGLRARAAWCHRNISTSFSRLPLITASKRAASSENNDWLAREGERAVRMEGSEFGLAEGRLRWRRAQFCSEEPSQSTCLLLSDRQSERQSQLLPQSRLQLHSRAQVR